MIDITALARICRDRIAQRKAFVSKAMPRVMLELIDQNKALAERVNAYAPVINAALEVKEDHMRIDQIDAAVANLPVELWP